jgi:hypothetical protein
VADRSGSTLVFAFMADQVPTGAVLSEAAKAIDGAAVALAGCGCR